MSGLGVGANVPAPQSVAMEAVVELFRFARQFAADKGEMAEALKALEEAHARNAEAIALVGKAEEIPGMWEDAAAAKAAAEDHLGVAEHTREKARIEAKDILREAHKDREWKEADLKGRREDFDADLGSMNAKWDERESAVALREDAVADREERVRADALVLANDSTNYNAEVAEFEKRRALVEAAYAGERHE